MKEIYREDTYIVFQYETALEFIEHYNKNFQYLLESWNDDDGLMCASYDIAILGQKTKMKFFIVANGSAWTKATEKIDVEDIRTRIKDKETHRLEALINAALQFKDQQWFEKLTEQYNKLR
jgi:hypothetical protein